MIGTYVNTGTILGGSLIGLAIGKHLPERLKTTIMQALGLATLLIGMQMALSGGSPLTAIACLLAGAVTGELLKIEQGIELAGEWLKTKTGLDSPTFVQGFASSSILYLSGAMMIVGCIQDGAAGDPHTLYVKSLLDGFAATALTATLGVGVAFSAFSVLLVQGAVTLLAAQLAFLREAALLTAVTATGGLMIVGISLNLLKLTRIRIGNFIPAIFYAIGWSYFSR
ncbi:MAG: DUF554 domain-containing protein [Syntrophobacterales bacterium]|nr:DUF554 domain-containing protein [Syntrophobacterales bacterium]